MLQIFITRQAKYQTDVKSLRKKVKDALLDHGVTQAEVSVVLVGARKMRELGQKYLNEKKSDLVHEVLAFPTSDPARSQKGEFVRFEDTASLGDIVICYPEARQIAIDENRMMDDVIGELAEHGILHLLGKHHE